MLGVLFCLISFTRYTFAYFSKQLFPNMMTRLTLPEIDEEGHATNQRETLDQGQISYRDGLLVPEKLRKTDVTDTVITRHAYEDEEVKYSYKSENPIQLPLAKNATHYNMTHKERGKCVIFNHDNFEIGVAPPRKGSDMDVDAIERTFKKLDFSVIKHQNLPRREIQDVIEKLSREDHGDRDCICIFLLTHGDFNGYIYAYDGLYPVLDVWKPFTADNCKSLAGKPKLFFIQACRGSMMEPGIEVYCSSTSETDSVVSALYKIPTHADFLLAHSSMEGFFSWREIDEGTWYIQCLCKVIEEYWDKFDLSRMLTITARTVAIEYKSSNVNPIKDNQKQMPSFTSTLTRDLIFIPKSGS